ncbi:MAG TPA: alpha-L-fucosidase [Candidatus Saccharimonadales bacterium]|nr:alpha-L-fucosidase [Candidatus Saccharimonadales bacterium]
MPSVLVLIVCFAGQSRGDQPSDGQSFLNEPPAQHDARMKWFREARFGMFIHWGLYSQAAGQWDGKQTSGAGEWIMNDMQIPDSQYAKLVPQFNPVKFDARQWVALAKNAGMKYIVITSKHHEGFGMYPSALTDWCIKSTPFQRDPLKELAAACQESGIKLCFYHSIMDWHQPDYLPRKPWNDEANPNADFDRYVAYLKGELKELLTGYGPIGILWFDGQWEDTWTYGRGVDLYNYVRGLQPDIIVNNRVGRDPAAGQPKVGDYGTPEQFIPASGYGPGVDWETCMTMNDTWGFKQQDHNWKSTGTLVRNLIDIASKGGNYLLNVGPTGEGLIPDASVERLQAIGQWMQGNGEAIYDTTASPFNHQLPWGRCTTKINGGVTTLYFHVFDWPADGLLTVPGLETKPKKVWLLLDAKKKSLRTRRTEDGLRITVPKAGPDSISTTIVAQFTRPLDISPVFITQQRDGSVTLAAVEARLHGETIRNEEGGGQNHLGYWTNPEDWVDWQFKVRAPVKFDITAQIAALASGSFDISIGGQSIHCAAPQTASYSDFKSVDLGVAEISAPGLVTLAVHPVKNGWQPMNLQSIELKPVTATP